MSWPKSYDDCDPGCTLYAHTPTCKRLARVRGESVEKTDALDALDNLVSALKAADPDGSVSFYLSNDAATYYTRAFQVLRDNGRRE